MDTPEVRYEVQGHQGRLTIDREAMRNALSPAVVSGLLAGLERAEADLAVRVLVVTGAGSKVFCAGGDLGGLSGDGFLAGHESRRAYGQLLLRLQGCRKPTVARVNGHALAGGFGLMLACDFAVAVDTAGFGTPEIDRGLFPMMVMALLQRQLGRRRSLELVMLGERMTAARALEWGLLNTVAPAEGFEAAVATLVDALAKKSQAILALGKRAYLSAEDLPLAQALELLSANLSLNVLADDAAEGVTAFLEKRPAKWSDR